MFEGWFGERKTQFNLWFSLNKELYRRFHDVIIPSDNGTTQVDHVLVSPFGLFIVETKNLKGWIYGSESQPKWTQIVYKNKYSFQNPLKQTYRQKKVLSKFLDVEESHIETVVCLVGDSKFKTDLPSNVLSSDLGRYIKQFKDIVLSNDEVERICGLLISTEGKISKREHIQSLHDRHTSDTVCPRCGSDLVERTVKQGPRTGSQFVGCSGYPKCRFTLN
jgi:restriction system protein